MLTHLYIRNYALICELDIDFSDGMTVITGETGAGKSIILGALGLITGDRADSKVITQGENKCVIEATFLISDNEDSQPIRDIFRDNDIDFDTTTVIRRELTSTGKSRAFVNDTPVQLSTLKALSERLIDIHSQHENLLIRNLDFQLSVVDAMADNLSIRKNYSEQYASLRRSRAELAELRQKAQADTQEADWLAFQLSQLQSARLQEGEETQLEEEITRLTHAEDIQRSLYQVATLLDESAALGAVSESVAQLNAAAKYLSDADELSQRLHSALIEMKDIRDEAQKLTEQTEYNPQRQAEVEQRLNELNTLMLKHRKNSTAELIELRDDIARRLQEHETQDERIEQLQALVQQQTAALTATAALLTKSREAVCPTLVRQLESMLAKLGMHNAKADFSFQPTDDFTPTGTDKAELLFAANKNQSPDAIARIASGGEIARLMLCLKYIVSRQQSLGTIIFDEIDTGVSGEVASNMGDIMAQMAQTQQILVITHLPQIAAKGRQHLKVFKWDTDTRTETHLQQLSAEDRVTEIATLLSGENITQAALDNARELLKVKD